ncbi:Histidine kinase-, DNA gyrase B-, and HSP90-like ATPase [Anaerosporobacter mobilis DSM 15930]|uniref:Histidine kinase-, DNA gyrase B-, and HSP90-like ATPase n=1 Tax=Anaerosporobacter mobilis DSM 15930 TaxID=1120996 RepID=A0A1M7F3M4_9FIRM|nr:ATP-binding protein [Anaerosporobacter mobilis]SHL98338.1 Histidine kinase-, DNA gyrase B-, and HSP90-like ATPase [Anaerosporobacter mobilis DSM 15930]
MVEKLDSQIEKRAELAETLRVFSGAKLLHIKKEVEKLLSHIGDYGIFTEYTKHDISHIDEMLNIAEWLIPDKTKEAMTSSEWMMLVLSIYFHDMGMLITSDEYDNRDKTDFKLYKDRAYSGEFGRDYIAKIKDLPDSDNFLFQEYIRKNHAKRIKMWISGELDENLKYTQSIATEIQKLTISIDSLFIQDLAMICESHHLNNLDDCSIYNTNKCYESSDQAKVNLQYIAVVLRTADLLHITMDRTPTIEFNAFCPSDPISVLEWQKQMAIRAIKPKEMRNEDCEIDKSIQSDAIAITAYFQTANQAEAFFALMNYLRYVKTELRTSYDIIQNSIKKQGTVDYLFPWKDVDDSGIETKNFSNHLLKFELDQNSILQMLVGHTLYNDSSVVIRELIQNGLDAIKLQNEIEKGNRVESSRGQILVKWDSKENSLSFFDNGTGMTVYEIENYLLKVGTSKYSSPIFQKEYPDFVSISRFGIGILTCFLVADDIEILTCSSENGEANRVFFRNVDGKYLLKSVTKDEIPKLISNHGTMIKLHLRDNENTDNLEYNIKKWIIFPYCDVKLVKDTSEPIKIGYSSPKEALEDYIGRGAIEAGSSIVIKEVEVDGITVAYALRYREYLQEYSLVEYNRRNNVGYSTDEPIPIGVCFEGIRIADNTPGYRRDTFLAIMNSNNNKIVKTNVARSSVEDNEGRDQLLKIIYTVYKKYLESQIEKFIKKGRSLSWISSEIKFLVKQLVNPQNNGIGGSILEKKEIFEDVFSDLETILFEDALNRKLVSVNYLKCLDRINMSESNMINAAEYLLKETKSNISLTGLVNTITESDTFTGQNLLCDYEMSSILHNVALKGKTANAITVNRNERKIDISFITGEEKWIKVNLINNDNLDQYSVAFIPKNEEEYITGLDEEVGVKTKMGVFLQCSNEMTKYLVEKISLFDYQNSNIEMYALQLLVSMVVNKQYTYIAREKGAEYFEKIFHNRIEREILERLSEDIKEMFWSKIDREELINMLMSNKISFYDLNDWSRRGR